MTAEERIRAALRFSDVPIKAGFRFRLLAEGAWHRAYRVTLFTGESLEHCEKPSQREGWVSHGVILDRKNNENGM
ncbi:hypothetical protein ACFQ40_11975 [Kroppenstedtia eburnea]|uniref:hypothetical protein n=1 Tax=Kroppenstedtia eburnea TaxID=714067 RepID=UPI003626AFCD